MIYIFWTCSEMQEAKSIVHDLLEKQLIACASLIPEVTSIYRWQGKIEENQEVKVILKTTENHFDAIQNYLQMHSSYDVPEIIQIDVKRGNPSYLSWISRETEG